jgi:hypothetical protein
MNHDGFTCMPRQCGVPFFAVAPSPAPVSRLRKVQLHTSKCQPRCLQLAASTSLRHGISSFLLRLTSDGQPPFSTSLGSLVDCELLHLGVAPLPRHSYLLFTSISRYRNVPGRRNGQLASGGRSGGACRGHGLRLRATGEGGWGDQDLGTRY